MFRKCAMSVVSVLAFMTLVVSAQIPDRPSDDGQSKFPQNTASPYSLVPQDLAQLGGYGWGGGPDSAARKEEFELNQQSASMVKQLAKAEGENKEKLKTKLTDTLGKQFDLRQKRHESELAALEAQVKKLKEIVQKRQENRKEIIGKRFDQLLRDSEGLGW